MRRIILTAFMLLIISASAQAVMINQDVTTEMSQHGRAEVIVKIKQGYNFDDVMREMGARKINITHAFQTFNGFSAEISRSDLERMRRIFEIEAIDYDEPVHIELQDSVPVINGTVLHAIQFNSTNITGAGQAICIIDTGINYSHPDLGGCSNNSFLNGSCAKVPGGYDFVNSDSNPYDDNGHGTHVAGIAAANGSIKGVAPGASIVAVKALNAAGSGSLSDVAAAIEWCTNNLTSQNVTVISMSLGTSALNSTYCDSTSSYASMVAAINNATARGISVVAASGNDGSNTSMSSPGCIQNVTSVASTTKTDGVSSFSNTNNLTGVFAPGGSINSTDYSGGYSVKSGTSMATPHVAGAIALLRQYKQLESGINLTAAQAKNALRNTGRNITDTKNSVVIPRIDVYAALLSIDASAPVMSIASPTPANNTLMNDSTSILANISASEALGSAILEWNNGTKINYTMNRSGSTAFINQSAPNGTYTYKFYATDLAGNSASTADRTIIVNDTSAPTINIVSPTPANGTRTNATSVLVNISASESLGSSFLEWDNGTKANYTMNRSGTSAFFNQSAANGTYTYKFYAADITGNAASTASRTVIIDTVTPQMNVSSPLNGSVLASTNISLSYSVLDNAIDKCRYINPIGVETAIANCVNITFTGLIGVQNITLIVNDTAGNTNSTRIFFNATSLIAVQRPENITYTGAIPINFTTTNSDFSSAWYRLDSNATNVTITGNITFNTTDGGHNITLFANNSAGAIDSSAVYFTVDTTAPAVTLNAPTPNNATINTTNSITINATVNEASSSATLEIDGANESMTRAGLSWTKTKILSDGNHTFKVYANDSVNNTGFSFIRYVYITTVRNETSFFSRLNQTNAGNNATTRLILNSTDADFANISIFQNYTLEFNISGIIVKVANFSALEANFSNVVNVTQNVTTTNITLNFTAAGGSLNKTVWVDMNSFVANFTPVVNFDRAYKIFFYLNGSREAPAFSRINYTCDANITNKPCFTTGTFSSVHLLSFSGAAAGDDSQAPEVNVTAPLEGATLSATSVSASFTASDNIAVDSCSYSLNGGANISLSGCTNFTITAASGSNSLRIYANDSSGNANQTTRNFTVSLPPASSSDSSSSGGGGGGGGSAQTSTADKVSFSIDVIRSEKPADLKIKSSAVSVKRLVIYVNSTQRDVDITIIGKNVTSVAALSDNTYQYMQVTKSRLDDKQISRIDAEFEVNLSWIYAKNLDEKNVWLFRFNDSSQLWDGYKADMMSANGTVARYNVSLSALSWLGITAMQRLQNTQSKPKEMCAQVITPAQHNDTCIEYSSPCDVPEGWTVVQSCEPLPAKANITIPEAPVVQSQEIVFASIILLAGIFVYFFTNTRQRKSLNKRRIYQSR